MRAIVNIFTALVLIFILYRIIFFWIMPYLVAHYRKIVSHRRIYDKRIEEIQKEDEAARSPVELKYEDVIQFRNEAKKSVVAKKKPVLKKVSKKESKK